MRALLDTHAFLWWVMDDARLPATAREVLEDSANELLFSAASGWEIAIKTRLGKLTLSDDPRRFVAEQIARNGFDLLPITLAHALHVWTLPDYHRDPFDRMLVAQSQVTGLPLMTDDPLIARYEVNRIW
ncbi:MAG TPA: type II toxin-antitoxin system VapC family toxin [Herpetosiphonaceae bacterium]|nr:type II toxin-antitoxin system VapC family toxin [Herpetosiphonaceae bacterium]